MIKKIAWGISGAGCWLIESFEVIGRILRDYDVKIDLFFSEAGREVAQCYGIFESPVPIKTPFIDKVREIPHFNPDFFQPNFVDKYQWLGANDHRKPIDLANDDDILPSKPIDKDFDYDEALHDVIFEIDEGSSFPTAASASNNRYDYVIISPATGNTVAKIANGIADSLLSNLAIMANKSTKTEVIIIPTDFNEGLVKSYLPIMLHSDTCKKCPECSALWACKPGAIRRKRGKIRINRLKCIGCLDCVRFCRYSVVSFLEETEVLVREREVQKTTELTKQDGFTILETPEAAYNYLCNILSK